MEINYGANDDNTIERKAYIKEENEKIDKLDRLFNQCMDLKFKSTGTAITIPMSMFRKFTDIVLDQKRTLVKNMGDKLEYDSMIKENNDLKQKIKQNEINNIIDEEYVEEDDEDDEDLIIDEDIMIENFKTSKDDYFTNSGIKPFNLNEGSGADFSLKNTFSNENYINNNFYYGNQDFGLFNQTNKINYNDNNEKNYEKIN